MFPFEPFSMNQCKAIHYKKQTIQEKKKYRDNVPNKQKEKSIRFYDPDMPMEFSLWLGVIKNNYNKNNA